MVCDISDSDVVSAAEQELSYDSGSYFEDIESVLALDSGSEYIVNEGCCSSCGSCSSCSEGSEIFSNLLEDQDIVDMKLNEERSVDDLDPSLIFKSR